MNLKISLYQFKRFKELGVEVTLTRDKDVYLSPEERTKIVRDSGAEYCISNHINAGGGDGVETIHSIYSDGKLATELADAIHEEGQNIRRVFTRTYPNDVHKDYYYMIRDTGKVNTVIIEYGFADSKLDDVEQLKNHWMDYAEATVKAFCNFTGHKYMLAKKMPIVVKQTIIKYEDNELQGIITNEGKSYAEIRELSKLFNLEVNWDKKTQTVNLKRRG